MKLLSLFIYFLFTVFSLVAPADSKAQECYKAAFTVSDVDLSGQLVNGKISLNKVALFKIRIKNAGLCVWEPYDITLRVKIMSSPSGASSYALQDMLPGNGGTLPLKERVLPKDYADFYYDVKLDDPKTVSGTYKLRYQLYSKSKPIDVYVDKEVEVSNVHQETNCKMLSGFKVSNVKVVPTGKILSGKKYSISATVDNLGTCTWHMERNKVELRIFCAQWPDIGAEEKKKLVPPGGNYLEASFSYEILPGKAADFEYDFIAPSAPGEYVLDLQMTSERKLFGPRYPLTITVVGDPKKCEAEAIVKVSGMPTQMEYNKEYPLVVEVTNTGICDWTADTKLELRCTIADKPSGSPSSLPLLVPENGVWALGSRVVKPGQAFEVRYKAKGPYLTGPYKLEWQAYARGTAVGKEVPKSFKVEIPK